jgi:hypothetical protein
VPSITSKAAAILVNAPTLESWPLLHGQAVAISCTTGIHASFGDPSRREGKRGEIGDLAAELRRRVRKISPVNGRRCVGRTGGVTCLLCSGGYSRRTDQTEQQDHRGRSLAACASSSSVRHGRKYLPDESIAPPRISFLRILPRARAVRAALKRARFHSCLIQINNEAIGNYRDNRNAFHAEAH